MTSLSDSKEFQLSSTAFFGRTFEEYLQFFALDPGRLVGRRVVDVAAGPSAFAAEAHIRGIQAIAVDPLYGCTPEALAAYVQIDYARVLAEQRKKEFLIRYGRFSSMAAAEASRRAAATRFLSDYETGFLHGRYVGAALPKLPFADAAFDLVLCAHLLFIYARRFDFEWHLAACRELIRVGRGLVRIHPLCGPDGREYPELGRLRDSLAKEGILSRVVPVEHGLFAGTDTTLIFGRAPGTLARA